MAVWFKTDIFPDRNLGSGFGMWTATLVIPWVIIWAIGDAVWGWGALGWWIGIGAILLFDSGYWFSQWETRRIADKLRLPETQKAGRRLPGGKHRP